MMTTENLSKKQKNTDVGNGFKVTAQSVAAAFLGVQNEKNRKRDFSQGKLSHFIITGILGVALFIGVLVTVVSLVLP